VVAAHQFEHGSVRDPVRLRADMREARNSGLGVVNERHRTLDVAHRPQYNREINHRRNSGVLAEAKG
jgi:hypothetical protein